MGKVRVLLADDQTVIRDALSTYFLNDDRIEVVAVAENGHDALQKTEQFSPDVVLTDLNMPVLSGQELSVRLRQLYPSVKVIVLTMINEDRHVKKALSTGVDGYVLKNSEKSELRAAILQVMSGECYFSPQISHKIMNNLASRIKKEHVVVEMPLSLREQEILRLIVQEYSNSEIANELLISTKTVDAHKRNLMEKTGSKNLIGLAIYAVEKGLV